MAQQTGKTTKKLIDREEFGRRLRALRKESGLTQTALAEKINATRSGVANWEKGLRFPESGYIHAMARVFCVPLDYLYGTCKHRYLINVPDYFELDMMKLNNEGVIALHEYYKLLLDSPRYVNKGL